MEQESQQSYRPPVKRTVIFVKKDIQLRYMAMMLGCVLLGVAIMSYEIISYLNLMFEEYPSAMQPFREHLLPMVFDIGVKVFIYLIIIVIMSSIISHRIAGPIYRFEQTCKDVAKGDFTKRVHLREKDSLVDLQDDFNAMMDTVEKAVNKTKEG
jgi:methyl-accepting chemotaxis protein